MRRNPQINQDVLDNGAVFLTITSVLFIYIGFILYCDQLEATSQDIDIKKTAFIVRIFLSLCAAFLIIPMAGAAGRNFYRTFMDDPNAFPERVEQDNRFPFAIAG